MPKPKADGSKTVRFTNVVERSGRPRAHTLWLAPDKDPELKRALASDRVMTVEQSATGGKADVGHVGFDVEHSQGAQILIFPKSLKRFEGARVVGVKFDLVEQPRMELARTPEAKVRKTTAKAGRLSQAAAAPEAKETPKVEVDAAKEAARETEGPPPKEKSRVEDAAPVETAPAKHRRPSKQRPKAKATPRPEDEPLVREIRAALKELEAGNPVAAYRRLERAIGG